MCGTIGFSNKTSQDALHPMESWTKPHKMRLIPGNPEKKLSKRENRGALVGGKCVVPLKPLYENVRYNWIAYEQCAVQLDCL